MPSLGRLSFLRRFLHRLVISFRLRLVRCLFPGLIILPPLPAGVADPGSQSIAWDAKVREVHGPAFRGLEVALGLCRLWVLCKRVAVGRSAGVFRQAIKMGREGEWGRQLIGREELVQLEGSRDERA